MGWLEWSLAVIGSTAWPIALVVIALILHHDPESAAIGLSQTKEKPLQG
ncbi:hypothetical protein [Edaphosphingomonas haloaromaticamans]|nr:hypothetical protein [Sphingomonas haloaromaticamans]